MPSEPACYFRAFEAKGRGFSTESQKRYLVGLERWTLERAGLLVNKENTKERGVRYTVYGLWGFLQLLQLFLLKMGLRPAYEM